MELLKEEHFRSVINGEEVKLFTLRNKNGCVAQFTNYGARWLSMWVPDKNGKWNDVVLGFDNLNDYLTAKEKYYGAVVGRVCGRISGGQFSLNGITYSLSNNDVFGKPVKNHLHGGDKGFSFRVWDGKVVKNENDEEMLELYYFSRDGEEGYPGNLQVKVTYHLSDDNAVHIHYTASCDQPTVINLTNHAYFNLSGNMDRDVLEHILFINANTAIECDNELIPTGRIALIENTALDFTQPVAIGLRIHENFPGHLLAGKGYAVTYVLDQPGKAVSLSATVTEKKSGRVMEVYTDQACLQLYNAWLFNGSDTGKKGYRYHSGAGLALEAQGYTDAPNHFNFPPVLLLPRTEYNQKTIYKFLVQPDA